MEKSDSYFRRKQFMKKLEVPMMSEIREQLGSSFADVFFEKCPGALKPDVGIEPKLEGPGEELWISPSDLLIGKVVLKPPVTSRYIRALTHEGILEIGLYVEEKFSNEMRIEKENALKIQEEYLNFLAERRLNNAVAKATEEITILFDQKIRELMEEFETRLIQELDDLEALLRKEFEETLRAREDEINATWKNKLETCIKKTVQMITEKYLENLQKKQKELTACFQKQIERERKRLDITLEIAEKQCIERMKQIKHNLECKSIANMMYIICMERKKYQAELNAVVTRYQTEVAELEGTNKSRQSEIDELVTKLERLKIKFSLREEFLMEILRQFQKFINFALRATPTQGEFLLSVEKMMLFELTKTIENFDKKESQEFDGYILPWKSISSDGSVKKSSLEAHDFHECVNELSPPESSKSSVTSNDFLPAFYYNNKMYVREDFRNLVSQDRKISKSNLLWNKDVENLMIILQRSVENVKLSLSNTGSTSPSLMEKGNQSLQSYVHFDKNAIEQDDTLQKQTDHTKLSNRGASLLSAIDSKELINLPSKRKEVPQHDKTSVERLGLLATSDSLTKYKQTLDKKTSNGCETCLHMDPLLVDENICSQLIASEKVLSLPEEMETVDTEEEHYIPEIYSLDECTCSVQSFLNVSIEKPVDNLNYVGSSKTSSGKFDSKNKLTHQSKISLHVDSFEILKKHKFSLTSSKTSLTHRESVQGAQQPKKQSSVFFKQETLMHDTYSISDSPWKVYKKNSIKSENSKSDKSINKPKTPNVVGDRKAKEHLQENKEFTIHRISSIMAMFNKNPSLMKMFTGCIQ